MSDKKDTTYNQIPQEHGNGHLADARYVDARLLLDGRPVEVAVARKVDAHGAVADELRRHLEVSSGHTADDYVAEGEHVFEAPSLLV